MESVEGVKKFFLNIFLAGDELNIINKNTIDGAVFVFKLVDGFRFKGRNELVTKSFGGEITDFKLIVFG